MSDNQAPSGLSACFFCSSLRAQVRLPMGVPKIAKEGSRKRSKNFRHTLEGKVVQSGGVTVVDPPEKTNMSENPGLKLDDVRRVALRNRLKDYIHTYIRYIHTNKTNKQTNKRTHTTTSLFPDIWRDFRTTVIYNEEKGVKPNHVLEALMLFYIEVHNRDPEQNKITQFFIKADQVNIADKQIVQGQPKTCDHPNCELPAAWHDVGLAGPFYACEEHHARNESLGLIKASKRINK